MRVSGRGLWGVNWSIGASGWGPLHEMRVGPEFAGIPDMRFINKHVAVADVARALDLRLEGTTKIHCWHPERHKNGDRTASVGIRASNNTVKCFGCDSKPMGPIDLVMDVLNTASAADAALWIAARFQVPCIAPRKWLSGEDRPSNPVGREQGIELLIRSGIWAGLSEPAKAIAPVLLEFGEKVDAFGERRQTQVSYRKLARYSGIQSHNAIRKGLVELSDVGFLSLPPGTAVRSPDRRTSTYVVTPNSDALFELANAVARQTQQAVDAEIELRRHQRNDRLRLRREKEKKRPPPPVY